MSLSLRVTLPKSAEKVFLKFDFGELATNLLALCLTKTTDILRAMNVLPRSTLSRNSRNIYCRGNFVTEFGKKSEEFRSILFLQTLKKLFLNY